MTRYLFVGPSMPDARTTAGPAVTVLPPIGGGDLCRLPLTAGDIVGIVDGYFHQQHAVQHKEILAALADGVRVLGAASIGALRAAELHPYGMEGVGGIYRDYRDGILTADDAVAVSHGTEDTRYRSFSQPLVNIRATLYAAYDAGLLAASMCDTLIRAMTTMNYQHRAYRALYGIAKTSGMPIADVDALRDFCAKHAVDRKRADAQELADLIRDPPAGPPPPAFELSDTVYLHHWKLQARGDDVPDVDIARVCQLFSSGFTTFFRQFIIDQIVRECAAHCDIGTTTGGPVDMAIAHGVHRGFYPASTRPEDFAFTRRWLTTTEWADLDLRERLTRFLIRSHAIEPGMTDIEGIATALQGTPGAKAARALIRATSTVNAHIQLERPGFDYTTLSKERITEWLATQWACSQEDLLFAALDRGLPAGIPTDIYQYYLAVRHNPGLTQFPIA